MPEIQESLNSARAAVDEIIRTSSHCATNWTTPRAPGKWSPSLVVEHIARSIESSADEIAGRPSLFPNLPSPVRFIVRHALFNRVLRKGTFPRAKTNRTMDPETGPDTPEAAAARLDEAWRKLADACAAAQGDDITSTMFGRVRLSDYLRFQEYHTRHHHKQMTPS
jgi:hypothetical protein